MKASDYIAKFLEKKGIKYIFELSGGMITHILDSLNQLTKIQIISMHHEQSAAFAAEGFARMTGIPGIALATSGPGATNLLTGIGSCYFDSVPCIFITGQVNRHELKLERNIRQLGFQEMPVVESFKPFTKFIKKVNDPTNFKQDLHEALTKCFECRPGPSLLDMPTNIQNSIINEEVFTFQPKPLITNINHQLKKLNRQLETSKRPLLLIGHGVRLSNAIEEIKELVNKHNNLLYAVPYQHFTNSIENYFSMLKSRLQKLDGLKYENLKENIQKVISEIPKEKYENIFKGAYERPEKYVPKNKTRKIKKNYK